MTASTASHTHSRRPTAPRMRCAGPALVVVAALVLGACSAAAPAGSGGAVTPSVGGGQGSPGPVSSVETGLVPKPDPCSLLTTDELKAQLGFGLQAGVLDPLSTASGMVLPGRAYCTWYPQDATVFRSVTLVIQRAGADRKAQFESDRAQAGAKPAPGVGDQAYLLIGSPGTNSTLSFEKGAWILDLNMSGADWQPTESMLTGIATLAASRL